MSIYLWILLYVLGFMATTIVYKYTEYFHYYNYEAWMFTFLWPICVPGSLLNLGFKEALQWWDRTSDRIVKGLQDKNEAARITLRKE